MYTVGVGEYTCKYHDNLQPNIQLFDTNSISGPPQYQRVCIFVNYPTPTNPPDGIAILVFTEVHEPPPNGKLLVSTKALIPSVAISIWCCCRGQELELAGISLLLKSQYNNLYQLTWQESAGLLCPPALLWGWRPLTGDRGRLERSAAAFFCMIGKDGRSEKSDGLVVEWAEMSSVNDSTPVNMYEYSINSLSPKVLKKLYRDRHC